MSESKKVLVAGSGAIGSVFACLLSRAGHEVTALARGAQLGALVSRGVRMIGIWGEHEVAGLNAVGSVEALDSGYDGILVCCKSFQTVELCRQVGDRLAEGGRAISLQNGLGNIEVLQSVFGDSRSLAARVIFGAVLDEPGLVRVTVEAAPVLVGNPAGGADASAVQWAAIFDSAGVNCRPSETVMGALWGKVFYNAALNPMGALLGLSYGELTADPLRRKVMDRVIEEAHAVASAEDVSMPWSDAADYQRLFYEELLPPTVGHRSSMLQDIEAGRPTEIDAICGEVVRRGEARGIDVSCNRMLLALLRERSRLGSG